MVVTRLRGNWATTKRARRPFGAQRRRTYVDLSPASNTSMYTGLSAAIQDGERISSIDSADLRRVAISVASENSGIDLISAKLSKAANICRSEGIDLHVWHKRLEMVI